MLAAVFWAEFKITSMCRGTDSYLRGTLRDAQDIHRLLVEHFDFPEGVSKACNMAAAASMFSRQRYKYITCASSYAELRPITCRWDTRADRGADGPLAAAHTEQHS